MPKKKSEDGGGKSPPPLSSRSKSLSKAIKSIDGFRLWSDVPPTLVIPTRISSLNRAIKCGGVPGGMLGVIHGPSQGGKTLLLAEILHAAWRTGGWGLFVDAECRAVDLAWFRSICASIEEIAYAKPKTYEGAIEGIQKLRDKFREAKDGKEATLPPEAFLAIGIDSINRLTPEKELEEITAGKAPARGFPLRALLTSKWLDRIIPTLERDESLIFIQREGRRMDAGPGQRTWNLRGTTQIGYDAGWSVRSKTSAQQKAGDDEKGVVCGEKHTIDVEKNSLGPHLNELAHFYSSTGVEPGMPLGLDFAREVREETIFRRLAIYKKGTGYLFRGEHVADSKKAYLKWLQTPGEDGRPRWEAIREELDAELKSGD